MAALACGGVLVVAQLVSAAPAAAQAKCGGLASAHCHCRVTAGQHQTTTSRDNLIENPAIRGTHLFTYTIPGKCFNQQWDAYYWRLNKGCWKACRDAAGVEGATPDPGFRAQVVAAGKKIREMGACGGWYGGVFEFAAGTNRFRGATAADLGIGIGGRVVKTADGKKVCR